LAQVQFHNFGARALFFTVRRSGGNKSEMFNSVAGGLSCAGILPAGFELRENYKITGETPALPNPRPECSLRGVTAAERT